MLYSNQITFFLVITCELMLKLPENMQVLVVKVKGHNREFHSKYSFFESSINKIGKERLKQNFKSFGVLTANKRQFCSLNLIISYYYNCLLEKCNK